MLDVAKGTCGFINDAGQLQEKEHLCSLGKEILKTIRNLRKIGKDR